MQSVSVTRMSDVSVAWIDNPPVNALSHHVREGLLNAIRQMNADPEIKGLIIASRRQLFCAGADVSEFASPPASPTLHETILALEESSKPIVAAIGGAALGGGLELALACDARVVGSKAKLGLPEVKLGLLPGAGGTQRLPRVLGPARALQIIADGEPLSSTQAVSADLAVGIASDDDLLPRAAAIVRELSDAGKRERISERSIDASDRDAFDDLAEKLLHKRPDMFQLPAIIEAVRATFDLDFDQGLALERSLFTRLRQDERSAALRYAFFAERAAMRLTGLAAEATPKPVRSVAVVGGGTMGTGIAMAFANAGIDATIYERDAEAARAARERMEQTYELSVSRKSLSQEQRQARLDRLRTSSVLAAPLTADLVIEAVYEELEVKRSVFRTLDEIAEPGTILATNTSFIDVDLIAAATARPGSVLGLHFFSPANIMPLVEIVRGRLTDPAVLASAVRLVQQIGKVPVVVGVCHGFVGNRMLTRRGEQMDRLLLEGATPREIDSVITEFGFRMGPCQMADLAGLDIGWRMRRSLGKSAPASDAMVEAGRLGQKTGKGFYDYSADPRRGSSDPEVERILALASKKAGIERRAIDRAEILERLIFPMINEGFRVIEEGIVERPSDIDVIWLNGYNWPRWRGGPMYYAQQIGLPAILDGLKRAAERSDDASLAPARLLVELAEQGNSVLAYAAKDKPA